MTTTQGRFSIRMFLVQVAIQLTLLLLAFRWLLPQLWAKQITAGWGAISITFLSVHLFICFFEWWFHRYVLHGTIVHWLGRFSRGHRHHHALTPIRLERVQGQPDQVVLNRYPITHEDQYEDAAFPVYALVAFWMLFTPPLVLVQWWLPNAPVMLGGYAAIAWSMILYEVLHAIEHRPYEWWKSATEHPRFGWMWTKLYGFHHYHHANIGWNEAISGFFGLPVADWVLQTYFQPKNLLLTGRIATIKDFHPTNKPWPFVAWLDRWVRARESKITRRA